MRKLFYVFFLLAFAITANAQWQADVRLTNNSATSYTSLNHTYCIAISGNFVHAVWYDGRDGNDEIYYKRSTDEGVTWGADVRLTNDAATSSYPTIAVSGSDVRVAWQDNRSDGRYEFYYKRSTDAGLTWGADIRLTNNAGESRYPSLAVSGTTTHLIWYNWRSYRYEIYYKKSLDGTNWGADTRITEDDSSVSTTPAIAVNNLGVHIVWVDERDGNKEIYYKRSLNGGITWEADKRLTNNSSVSQKPCIAVSSQGNVYVAWVDNRDGNYEIYYKGSLDGGTTWGSDTRITNTGSSTLHPTLAVSDSVSGRVHLAWMDVVAGNNEILYSLSTDGGLNWGSAIQLTNSAGASELPSICGIPSGGSHIIWQDNRDGNYEIYYKRNPTSNVGIINLNTEIPSKYSLSQNYPNPFNPATKIIFTIPQVSSRHGVGGDLVQIKVFDVSGREVETLVNEQLQAGTYSTQWNASNYSSGIYFYKITAGDFSESKRMLLIK